MDPHVAFQSGTGLPKGRAFGVLYAPRWNHGTKPRPVWRGLEENDFEDFRSLLDAILVMNKAICPDLYVPFVQVQRFAQSKPT